MTTEVVGRESAQMAAVSTGRTGRVSLVIAAKNKMLNLALVSEATPDCVDEIILVDGDSGDATVAMGTSSRRGW
jgi:hypothetical protein